MILTYYHTPEIRFELSSELQYVPVPIRISWEDTRETFKVRFRQYADDCVVPFCNHSQSLPS